MCERHFRRTRVAYGTIRSKSLDRLPLWPCVGSTGSRTRLNGSSRSFAPAISTSTTTSFSCHAICSLSRKWRIRLAGSGHPWQGSRNLLGGLIIWEAGDKLCGARHPRFFNF